MKLNDNLYTNSWTGGDSPIAREAFLAGQQAAIQVIASWRADQPSSYEEAACEDTWAERLANVCNQVERLY